MARFPRPAGGLLLALLVASVFVVSAGVVAGAVGTHASDGPTKQIVPVDNTTNHLSPPASDLHRSGYGQADLDVAGAIAGSVERLDGRHQQLILAGQVAEAGEESLPAVTTTELDRIEERIETIRSEHGTLMAAYGNGTIGQTMLTRRLAHIQSALTQQVEQLDALERHLEQRDSPLVRSLETRFATIRGAAVEFESPLAGKMMSALNASRESFGYYMAGGPEGIILAVTDEDEFNREAYSGANRTPGATNQFAEAGSPTLAAFNRAAELYPWAFGNAIRQSAADFGTTQIYEIRVEHDQGLLTTFLDGGTTDVFREIQRKQLEAVSMAHTVSASSDDLRLRLNTTTPTGPMRVSLQRLDAEQPIDGTIRIGDQVVGSTGSDGVLWTVQPGAGTQVNATVGSDTVSATP